MATPPQPPRLTGDPATDVKLNNDWAWDFYRSVVLENFYTTASDVADLVDPAGATAASAQNTANQALTIAQQGQAELQRQDAGTAVITDPATTIVVPITAQPDLNYRIVASAVSFTGAPVVDSLIVKGVTKALSQFTLEVFAAPGAAATVTFEWQIQR